MNTSECVVKLASSRILWVQKFTFSIPKELIFLHMTFIYAWKTIIVENLIQIVGMIYIFDKNPQFIRFTKVKFKTYPTYHRK